MPCDVWCEHEACDEHWKAVAAQLAGVVFQKLDGPQMEDPLGLYGPYRALLPRAPSED